MSVGIYAELVAAVYLALSMATRRSTARCLCR